MFNFCGSLETFSSMVDGSLDKLKILNVSSCNKLRSIPPLKLGSLQELDISCCDSLEIFPPVVDGLLELKILSCMLSEA